VAPLTATALASVPARHVGLASAVNNDVARIGGLLAVAVLPAVSGIGGTAYLHADQLAHGFRSAAVLAGAWCAAGGVLAAVGIRNPPAGTVPGGASGADLRRDYSYCALDAPPRAVRG